VLHDGGPQTQRTGWSRRRIMACATGSVLAPLLLFTVFYLTDDRRNVEPTAGAATGDPAFLGSTPPPSAPAPTPKESAAEAVTAAPTASAAAGGTVDGLDGVAWRRVLKQTVATSDWKRGASAIVALGQIDPAALEQPDLTRAAAAIAMAVELTDSEEATHLYDALAMTAGGVDVLYDISSRRGGSKAAVRATEKMSKEEVRQRASPALKITLEMREAACADKEALLDRAVAEGDHRTLVVLIALRSPECSPGVEGCCMRSNEKLQHSVRQLSARLRPVARPSAAPDPY